MNNVVLSKCGNYINFIHPDITASISTIQAGDFSELQDNGKKLRDIASINGAKNIIRRRCASPATIRSATR